MGTNNRDWLRSDVVLMSLSPFRNKAILLQSENSNDVLNPRATIN